MVYLMQRYQGIKVYNAIYNVGISKEGKVVHAASRIVPNIVNKVGASTSPSLTPEAAIAAALSHLNVAMSDVLVQKERKNEQEFVFEKGAYSNTDIKVNLQFFPTNENEVELAWEVVIDMVSNADYWNVKVDAVTGNVLGQHNYTTYCTFAPDAYHNHDAACRNLDNMRIVTSAKTITVAPPVLLGGSYAVFADQTVDGNLHTHESPSHGDRNLLTGIENLTASPYGWHDTNGQNGPEFTITRGNNVHAYLDIDGSNNSQGDEPDGGAELLFDFPMDLDAEPETFQAASVTNGFFMSNVMHDFSYVYGFDEAAGNFQSNNYGNGGNGGDYVNMHIDDGSGTNNANFSTPPDGQNPRMQMFLWDGAPTGDILTINDGPLAGSYFGIPADFGGPIPNGLTEDLVLVDDSTGDSHDACDPITNGVDLNGKIVVIRRGDCEFGFKALAAQNEGAIAVIMVNNVDGDAITMAGGEFGDQVTIPLFMISNIDGEPIIAELMEATVNGTINDIIIGEMLDADLDNEIIAHEYGHGISIRLTGGANTSACLNNAEQMGEGWSDWFGLMITMKVGDQADEGRGMATYSAGQGLDGNGIRQYKYCRDMTVNPLTYADLPATGGQVHAVGTIWATMIWDLNWDLIDEYGYDPDMYNGTGGNNIAMQLIIDGLKLQPCSPGFVDGRDAILEADELAYGGANQCIIWDAFARRGLGFSAVSYTHLTLPTICSV